MMIYKNKIKTAMTLIIAGYYIYSSAIAKRVPSRKRHKMSKRFWNF